MTKRVLFAAIVMFGVLAACSPQAQEAETAPTATLMPILSHTPRFTATPIPSRTPLPTFTFTPTETEVPPTPTLSPTPTMTPTLTGIVQSVNRVNVREGPGVDFSAFEALAPGTGVQIVGRNSEGDWLRVRLEDGREGWMSARLIFLPPTATPFPTPTPSPDATVLFLGTPLPTAIVGGGTVTPTPPGSVTTGTPASAQAEQTEAVDADATADQSFIPVVDLDSINMTATSLAAGAPTSTPTQAAPDDEEEEDEDRVITVEPQPTDAETGTEAAAAPTAEDDGISQEEAAQLQGVDVFAFCDRSAYGIAPPQNLAAGSTIDIFWAWFARTEEQVRQHIEAANHELSVNGEPIENVGEYRTRIRQDESGDYVTYWYVPYGPLAAGTYEITYRVTWDRPVFDGYAYFGPDTGTPFEEESCTFTVR